MMAMTQDDSEIMAAYTVVFDGLVLLGPGDAGTTRNLVERLRPYLSSGPRVADFGCGVGASTLMLAQTLLKARVLALDSHAPFISRLQTAAITRGLSERISAVVGNMAEPPPLDGMIGEFDLIWSESAIYVIGRINAFSKWRPLLRSSGWLVFSDIVWQREPAKRSAEASAFWTNEYPDIETPDAIVVELAAAGFHPLEPVFSGRNAWSNYYEPLRDRLRLLAKRQDRSQALIDVMAELEREIAVYDLAGDDVALAFFLAQRDSITE
jgi:SAM-dependent methyltransferase